VTQNSKRAAGYLYRILKGEQPADARSASRNGLEISYELPRQQTVPHALDELLSEPRIGRIGFSVGVPVEVAVERRDLEGKWQKPVAKLGVEDAGIARGHRQNEVGLAHHAAGGEVALAAQADATAQVVPAQLEVLCAQATATR
jgi:hypothetical protein